MRRGGSSSRKAVDADAHVSRDVCLHIHIHIIYIIYTYIYIYIHTCMYTKTGGERERELPYLHNTQSATCGMGRGMVHVFVHKTLCISASSGLMNLIGVFAGGSPGLALLLVRRSWSPGL